MGSDITTALLSFLEGVALILSPCIWPILPIILSGSLTGRKSRPLGIILGFALSFALVTLFSRQLVQTLSINPNIIRNVSFTILFLLGLVMVSPYLTEKFNQLTRGFSNVGRDLKSANDPNSSFFGGLLFGGLIGIIWTPCAGPIIAAVIVQTALQQTNFLSFINILLFALGAGLPMLIIAFTGRSALEHFRFISQHTIFIRQLLGVIIIATVILLFYQNNAALSFSDRPLPTASRNTSTALQNGVPLPYPAPEIAGIDAWLNSPPLSWQNLKGKVVLIDFWTYSCINCIRTLPYLKDWYDRYRDQGLIIIGVHSPEFQFEHDYNNVKNAVEKFGIHYPVALDNDFVTWRNFTNQYWPAHYLVNQNGLVVYEHFGEGDYEVTENNIRFLLGTNRPASSLPRTESGSFAVTPETYLGSARMSHFASHESILENQAIDYHYPTILPLHYWALRGKWIVTAEKIIAAEKGASLQLHFQAKDVYAVMGNTKGPITAHLLLNRTPIHNNQGNDVNHGQITIKQYQLYSLIHYSQNQTATIEIVANDAGLELYTFTFGG